MLRMFIATLALFLSVVMALADFSFGPTPRALDNITVFDTRAPLRKAEWDALRESGVHMIDLNPTFLMRAELGRAARNGSLLPRHHGTYLDDQALQDLRDRVRDGFSINYQAGISLSADRCGLTDPTTLGREAARAEYTHVISFLHRASIPVAEVSVDGPFLRLLQGSRKAFSCADGTRNSDGIRLSDGEEGKSITFTAQAVHAYIEELVDQIAQHQSRPPVMALTINLPNWREGALRSAAWPALNTSLSEMIGAFKAVRRGAGQPFAWVRLDYPACYLNGTARCGGGTAETFVAKTAALWQASRTLNGTARPPALAVVANDIGSRAACMPPNDSPEFLAYRNYRDQTLTRYSAPPARTGYTAPDPACQISQRDGPDRQFINSSFSYANSLTKGRLAARLAQADPTLKVSRIAFQSWGVSPMSNLWYIGQIRRYVNQQ